MIKPSDILTEHQAINKLKVIKISAWKAIECIFIVSGSILVYYNVLKPLKQNLDKIPGIEHQMKTLQKTIPVIDTSMNSTIRETNKNVIILTGKVKELDGKMNILKEEFPEIKKRFDDIELGFNAQILDFKKKRIDSVELKIKGEKLWVK